MLVVTFFHLTRIISIILFLVKPFALANYYEVQPYNYQKTPVGVYYVKNEESFVIDDDTQMAKLLQPRMVAFNNMKNKRSAGSSKCNCMKEEKIIENAFNAFPKTYTHRICEENGKRNTKPTCEMGSMCKEIKQSLPVLIMRSDGLGNQTDVPGPLRQSWNTTYVNVTVACMCVFA